MKNEKIKNLKKRLTKLDGEIKNFAEKFSDRKSLWVPALFLLGRVNTLSENADVVTVQTFVYNLRHIMMEFKKLERSVD